MSETKLQKLLNDGADAAYLTDKALREGDQGMALEQVRIARAATAQAIELLRSTKEVLALENLQPLEPAYRAAEEAIARADLNAAMAATHGAGAK